MVESVITTKSEQETIELGRKVLAEALAEAKKEMPLIFYLEGELGAGKTYFVKGVGQALGITAITSPTFILMKKFKISRLRSECEEKGKKYFFHIDCYRIYDAGDARQIGLDDALKNPRAVIAIEWAERIADIIPKPYWKVEFKYKGEGERKISIRRINS